MKKYKDLVNENTSVLDAVAPLSKTKKYKWITMDADGTVDGHVEKPYVSSGESSWESDGDSEFLYWYENYKSIKNWKKEIHKT